MPGVVALVAIERSQDLLESDAELEAGEVRPEAEMDSVAEGEMRVRIAPGAERIRIGEVPFVAVGRPLPHHHLLTGLDRKSAEPAVVPPNGRLPPVSEEKDTGSFSTLSTSS
jgi:hypothetical protein